MAEQVGCQSGTRTSIHNHLNISQGGVLNDYSRYGAYRQIYRGALARALSNAADKTTTSPVWTLLKQITINQNQKGQCQISYDAFSAVGAVAVDSRVYVNGVAVGPINSCINPTTFDFDYDVDLVDGDMIQIWGKRNGAGDTIHVENMFIRYDWNIAYFGDGTSRVLTAPLALTDVDLLLHTDVL